MKDKYQILKELIDLKEELHNLNLPKKKNG